MSAKRYTDEQKAWYFKNIVDAGIPPASKKAMEMLLKEWGKAPSKSTLHYWTNPGEKQRKRARTQKYRKENIKIIVGRKLYNFRKHTPATNQEVAIKDKARTRERGLLPTLRFTINNRITKFHAKGIDMSRITQKDCTFLAADLLKQIEKTQNYNSETHDCVCSICGEKLNLINDTWHLDHINPLGDNSKENASCVHSKCNSMKSYLSMEELVSLAKKVVAYQDSKKEVANV